MEGRQLGQPGPLPMREMQVKTLLIHAGRSIDPVYLSHRLVAVVVAKVGTIATEVFPVIDETPPVVASGNVNVDEELGPAFGCTASQKAT